MLALCLSFVAALYLLGPDLLSRWILGFVVPGKTLSQNRGEEITRAVLWAAVPLGIVIGWVWRFHVLESWGSIADLQTVVSGLYSDRFFDEHRVQFYTSLRAVSWMNCSLLWRLILVVSTFSIALDIAIVKYSFIRRHLPYSWMKYVLAMLLLPRVSEWHVMLSDMLLPNEDIVLTADVLTRSETLYQGSVKDKMLGNDGTLQSLSLSEPKRFLRDEFRKQKEVDENTSSDLFWRSIPGNVFVILGSDIVNINIRYTRKNVNPIDMSGAIRKYISELLSELSERQGDSK